MQLAIPTIFVLAFLARPVLAQEKQPSQEKVREQLEGKGFDVDLKNQTVTARVTDAASLKAFGLLAHLRELKVVEVEIFDHEFNSAVLKTIGELPKLESLYLTAELLTKDDLAKIVAFKQLEVLVLDSRDMSEDKLKMLHTLNGWKKLQRLQLTHGRVSPKSLDELKRALPQVKDLSLQRELTHLQPVPIMPADAPLVKLQKAKLNAAIAELTMRQRLDLRCFRPAEDFFVDCAQRVKAAVIDLNDPEVTRELIYDYVDILVRAEREGERKFKAGQLPPEAFHRLQYYSLDAQIWQMRVKGQKKVE
jgi:hypothetical protein